MQRNTGQTSRRRVSDAGRRWGRSAFMLMALGALLAVVSGCANRGEGAGWSWAEGRDAFDRGDYVTAEREWSRSLAAWEKGHPVDEDTAYFNEQLAKVQNALGK
jgi:hypothetical protein